MPAISILFPTDTPAAFGRPSGCSADLHLDQLVTSITTARAEYRLEPLFFTPLTTADEVRFRQEIFRDLRGGHLAPMIEAFAEGMRKMRRVLNGIKDLRSHRQQQAWLLDAASFYCQTLDTLTDGLSAAGLESRGLRAVREYLCAYAGSEGYQALRSDAAKVKNALHGVRYGLRIDGNRIIVSHHHADDVDYSPQVLLTFERFRQRRDGTDPAPTRPASTYMNHIDARVLDGVARLHPSEFAALDRFCETHRSFVDDTVASFDREIQFYVAVSEFLDRLTAAGLPVCYPDVSEHDKAVEARDVCDIALADKLLREERPVVLNDLVLTEDERIVVVTGPNQGGKTTFARMFGQLHHLAALGCPTPGTRVRVGLFDRIFSHFERTEDLRTLSGKLEDELVRIRHILDDATSHSIVIMNESLTSTSLRDARLLGTAILQQFLARDLRAVYVTFVDELSRLGPAVVSIVGTVAPDEPSRRTYKLARRPADGIAYAVSLAQQHGLTARQITERIGR